jgi:hypothetical protein
MLKKISFYFFIGVSLLIAIWGYFKLIESKEPKSNILEHISDKTFCVIETDSYSELVNQFFRQNIIWNGLSLDSNLNKVKATISYLDSLVVENAELKGILEHNNLFLSCFKQDSTINYLLQFKLKKTSDEHILKTFLEKTFDKNTSTLSLICYYKIVHQKKWLISLYDGIVMISDDLNLLLNSVNLKKEESLSENKNYLSLKTANGAQKTTVFINNNLHPIFNKDIFNSQLIFNTNIKPDQISLSGYSLIDSNSIFKNFEKQNAQALNFYDDLPDNPISFSAISLSDANQAYSFLCPIKQNKNWEFLNDTAMYDIKKEFLTSLDLGILSAKYELNGQIQNITLSKTNDSTKTNYFLKLVSDSSFQINEVLNYRIKPVYQYLFSWLDKEIKNNYISINKNTIAFTSHVDVLNYYINAVSSSKTISKNSAFMNYARNNLMVNCNYLYYENAELINKNKLSSFITINPLNLKSEYYTHLSLLATQSHKSVKVRINLMKESIRKDENNNLNYLWTFSADAKIKNNLHLFKNHTTQDNEIIFQDDDNTLYLMSSTGNLIWKKKLLEPIKSTIYTVDVFKNGKLQVLFNTKNHLYIIDRNGNYLQGYPIKSPANITSNITLLDYNYNRDYRILIACADKKIYNYNIYGLKTDGFIPFKTSEIVELPINYLNVGLSDYLIAVDVAGNIYVFSRKGLGRIDIKNKAIKYLNNIHLLEGSSIDNSKIIYVDEKENLLVKISLADKKENIKLGDELSGFKTSFQVLTDGNQKGILCYGSGAFYGYDLFSNKLVESFNDKAIYTHIDCARLPHKLLYIAFDENSTSVEVINSEGKLEKQYPNVTFKPLIVDLYKDGKQYVLMIENNTIKSVELN